MRRAFTILEILVAIIMVGILAGLALPQFSIIKERALDKEAKANLVLIRAAQNVYHLENNAYCGSCSTTLDINTNLKLNFPTTSGSWVYNGTVLGYANQARATKDDGSRYWTINYTDNNDPICNGTCL